MERRPTNKETQINIASDNVVKVMEKNKAGEGGRERWWWVLGRVGLKGLSEK